MKIIFTVANWNIGGAKYLEVDTQKERNAIKESVNHDISSLITGYKPDVMTFQEVVLFGESRDKTEDIIDKQELSRLGYDYYMYLLC